MSYLAFYLLGMPRLQRDGAPLRIARRRARAVAIYLAATGRQHSREALLACFWPDLPASKARADLRRTLSVLRRALGDGRLVIDSDQVHIPRCDHIWLDIDEFQRLISEGSRHDHPPDQVCVACLPSLASAADLYRDDFLAGFSLPDSPQFDAWQYVESERLRADMANILARLIQWHEKQHNPVAAIHYAYRWLALDPLDEGSHQRLMMLYAQNGHVAAACRQYEHCAQLLQQELGVTPSPETELLLRTIRAKLMPVSDPDMGDETDCDEPSGSKFQGMPPASDDIRLVTVVAIGLVESAFDAHEPALDDRLVDVESLLAIAEGVSNSYGGTLLSSAGEEPLILFGVDRTHEDDAERGVRAGLKVAALAGEQGLAVQAGVNSGMVYVRQAAAGRPYPFVIMGPVLNLATRIRNQAGSGEVLVGTAAYRATRGVFDYETRSRTLPGVEGSLPVLHARKARVHPVKKRGIKGPQAALIGREAEMDRLVQLLADVIRDGRGQMAAIVADAGVGKSRLVAELRGRTRSDAFLWLEGRSQSLTSSTSYWVFIDMLLDCLSRHGSDGRVADSLVKLLHRLEEANKLCEEDVEEIGPLLGRLLSLRFNTYWDEQLDGVDAVQLRRRTLAALRKLFEALAGEQPLVLVCEDLHWADPLSLNLMGALMESLATVPLMVLAVYRPEETQADGQLASLARRRCPERFTELRIQTLSVEESRQVVTSLLANDDLSPAMWRLIMEKAEGNPLYLEEMVRSFINAGVLYQDGTTWRSQATSSVDIPISLQSIILSRIDRLEPEEQAYLQAASVLGRLFLPRLVNAMTLGSDQDPILASLVQEAFVYQERTHPEPEYSFHHVLTRDTIYQDLPRGLRVVLHRRAAQAIELLFADDLQAQIELLAHHYDYCEDASRAAHYQILAGRKAQDAYLNQEARSRFERALALLEGLEPSPRHQSDKIMALHRLGEVQWMLEQVEEAKRCLQEAIALAAEQALPPLQRADIMLSFCRLAIGTGDNRGLFEQGEQGLALIAGIEAPVERVAFTIYLAAEASARGDQRLAMDYTGSVIDIIPALPVAGHMADVYWYTVFWCRFNKQVAWGFELVINAIERARQRRDFELAAHLQLLPKMFLHETIGDATGALASIIEATRLAEMADDRMMIRRSWYWLGICHGWIFGNLDVAERYARLNLEGRGAMFKPSSYLFARIVLGLVEYCRRDWREALAVLESAHKLATSHRFRVDGVRRGMVGLAWTYAMLDRKADGLALLTRMAQEEELHVETWPTVACALAGLEAMCADVDAYDSLCREIVAARQDEPLPLVQWRLLPAQADTRFEDAGGIHRPDFGQKPGLSGWTWHDPFGDCSYQAAHGLLTICAANYHDLWLNNFAAPRLLTPVRGDFMVETVCCAVDADRPALGGLLLWKDRENYLRLTWNTHAPDGINLLGCIHNVDLLLGLGRLPDAQRVLLRIERVGLRVRALCSADGVDWYSVAEVDFPVEGPVEVGPLAIGMIHRYVHAGAWPEGSAIRFESFALTALEPSAGLRSGWQQGGAPHSRML